MAASRPWRSRAGKAMQVDDLISSPYQRSPPGRSTLLAIKRRCNLRKRLIRITEIREGTHDRSPILGPDLLRRFGRMCAAKRATGFVRGAKLVAPV